MRRTGRAECLAFIFYVEDYGKGKVTVDGKGNQLNPPKEYPQNREELIMRVNDTFSPHGIMIGLHDDNPPDKDHEHWYLGFENSRFQPNDFEPLARQMGFVVSPEDVYQNRPDTLEDYIKHISDAAKKDCKKEYDDSHIWKSEYWNPQLYMSQEFKRDLKREQRENESSTMDVQIIKYIEDINIRYFPQLLAFLQEYNKPALYNYVLMQRSSFYGMYLRELRECDKYLGNIHYKKMYPEGTNSEDPKPYKPEPEPVKMSYSESQAVFAKSTDEVFGASPEPSSEEAPPAEAPAEAEINLEEFEVIGPDGENPFE